MRSTLWISAAGLVLIASLSSQEPQSGDVERRIWNTEFRKQRSTPQPQAKVQMGATKAQAAGSSFVGVTLWRLRPARLGDSDRVRALVHENGRDAAYTPERIGIDTPLREGDRVQLSIESALSGYLYVITREKYTDGSLGKPELVFPSARLRGGANAVQPGVLVDIPDTSDRPNYLTLRRSRPDQAGEMLILLVTPQPIPGMVVQRDRVWLEPKQIEEWQGQAKVIMLDSQEDRGAVRTPAEMDAASGLRLSSTDPVPQTLYKLNVSPKSPVLVSLLLTIAK